MRIIWGIALLLGCDGAPDVDAGRADAGTDAGRTTVGACSEEDRAACAYEPVVSSEPGPESTQAITYTDDFGLERTIEIELRLPSTAAGEAVPLVVWSHGGASGLMNAGGVGMQWSAILVRAGYAFLAIAHAPRTPAQYDALCNGISFDDCSVTACMTDDDCRSAGIASNCVFNNCRMFKHVIYDRPHDFAQVLDALERATMPGGPLEGRLDLDRIVYAGHSAGAGSTMSVAGAPRFIAGTTHLFYDPRPIAFVSASPQGPGDEYFTELSFDDEVCRAMAPDPSGCWSRPHLYLTGNGDEADTTPEVRRMSFELAPATGERYLAFILEEAARHTTFEGNTDACERYAIDQSLDPSIYPARCATYLEWLSSVFVAFLDAFTRDSADARAWLASDNGPILAEQAMTLELR